MLLVRNREASEGRRSGPPVFFLAVFRKSSGKDEEILTVAIIIT